MKRTPLKRKPTRRASEIEFRGEEKAAIERRSGGKCEARTPVCTKTARVFHRIKLRGQGGKGTRENGIHICSACHVFLHMNVRWAIRHRMIVSSWEEGFADDIAPGCPRDCAEDHAVDI